MRHDFTDDDEGKKVVRGDDTVGRIVAVEHGTAYVDADPGLSDKLFSKLGWGDHEGEDKYPLQEAMIERVDDDAVYLER